jgi:tetratricopeptide (TPR) repeat protein
MRARTASLLLSLLWVSGFALAAWLVPRDAARAAAANRGDDLLAVLLGDSRRLVAHQFFVKADVYFHSGFYPTMFDEVPAREKLHVAEQGEHDDDHDGEHARPGQTEPPDSLDPGFLGPPKDWLDAFARQFYPSRHTHLETAAEEREVLPWLRLSLSLDPGRVEGYVVAAYWLRHRLGRGEAAEQLLREGWRANPNSPEILFELGRVNDEVRHDASRARNLWELALRKWEAQEAAKPAPNLFLREQVLAFLARLEEQEHRPAQALRYLELLKQLSPHPELIQKQIETLRSAQPHAGVPEPRVPAR